MRLGVFWVGAWRCPALAHRVRIDRWKGLLGMATNLATKEELSEWEFIAVFSRLGHACDASERAAIVRLALAERQHQRDSAALSPAPREQPAGCLRCVLGRN